MLICLSASHATASLNRIEALAAAEIGPARVVSSIDGIAGGVVVSTCNRFEIYAEASDDIPTPNVSAALQRFTADLSGMTVDELRSISSLHTGDDVAEHLFSVASGLESLVVGETEISGQVSAALLRAHQEHATTAGLERLFQTAAHTSRTVKTTTSITSAGRSLVHLALDLAETRLVDWSSLRALLVGTGRYARVTAAALRDRGVTDVHVFSHSGRARGFAEPRGLVAAAPDSLRTELAAADLIVTCTSTSAPEITADDLRAQRGATAAGDADGARMSARHVALAPARRVPARQMIIDLGLPRNVATEAADLDWVDVLDLKTIQLHAPLSEVQASLAARDVVRTAAEEYREQANRQRSGAALAALRSTFFDALDGEIARASKRAPSTANTEKALRHLTGVLLNIPMQQAHRMAAAGRADEFASAITAAFGLGESTDEHRACRACPVAHAAPRLTA